MHIGNARSALFPFLLARRIGGTFVLRIEDTDQKRYDPNAEQGLIDGLHWLGIQYDEGPDIGGPYAPYRQTERRKLYFEHAWKLVDADHAFACFCTSDRLEKVRQEHMKNKQNPRYDGFCRNLSPQEVRQRVDAGEKYVIRFKMPKTGSITAIDLLRGNITTENSALDDSVILKSDGLPTYHLAAMLDDHLMEITHVIRGSEWLPSLALHTHIIRASGWDEPVFAHLSIFLKPSGKGKMSKRDKAEMMKDGYSIFVNDMKDLGYTPEGVLNWIALMGWGVAEDDVMSLDQMVERFSIDSLTPSPAAINFQKLDHFNATHIRLMTNEDLSARLKPYFTGAGLEVQNDALLKITPLIRERLVTLDDCLTFASFFFKENVEPNPEELIAKGLDAQQSAEIARKTYEILASLPELSHPIAEPPMRAYVESSGLNINQVFGLLRVAVTGQKVSPPLFESMEIIGKAKCLKRVQKAIALLAKM